MTKLLQIAGLIICGIVAVSLFSLGSAVNKGDEAAKRFTQVRSQISMGMYKSQVSYIAGEPEDTQSDTSTFEGTTSTTDYWYYGVLSDGGWQLVFEDGRLTSINQN